MEKFKGGVAVRHSSEIHNIMKDQSVEEFLSKLESREINYYQALGLESGDFSDARRNSIVAEQVKFLMKEIGEKSLTEENKAVLCRTVTSLVDYLSNSQKKVKYDQTLLPSPEISGPSIPISPVVSPKKVGSPVKSKREQRELDQLLGGNLEEYSISFRDFLRGDALPVSSPIGSSENLGNIRLSDSPRGPAVNADLLLQLIKEHSQFPQDILKKACDSLGLKRSAVTTPKQQLWALLKSKDEMVKGVVKAAMAECFPVKPSSPSPRR